MQLVCARSHITERSLEKIRRVAYVVILGGFVGAAALCVLIDGISHALYAAGIAPPWAFQVGSVPILRDFDDPAGRILRLMTPEPHYKPIGYVEPEARTLYARWHGATFVAILILLLGVRRWRTFRGDLTRLPPPSFGGAAAGIALAGLALMALGWLGGWRLVFPVEPINAGAMFAFAAFLMSELW